MIKIKRKRGVNNNNNNKLLYDPNQRQQKRLGAFSMGENNSTEEEQNTNTKTNANTNENSNNELNNNQNELENKKEDTNNTTEQSDNESGEDENKTLLGGKRTVAGRVAAKVLMFLLANPVTWLFLGVFFLILIIVVILGGGADTGGTSGNLMGLNGYPYYELETTCKSVKVYWDGDKTNPSRELDFETEYLPGVIYREIREFEDSPETLQAVAIAARSYAVATKTAGKHASKGYDLVDTTADQAYGGASAEKYSTSKAVDDTKGIVLVQNSKVIPTYYHASSGGQTKVWSSGSSFLQSVPSFDEGTKKNGHGVGMSQHGANNLAAQGYNAYQILNYFYKDFKFAKLSENWDL